MGFNAKGFLPCVLVVLGALVLPGGVGVAGAAGSPAWSVRTVTEPTRFTPADKVACRTESKCDRYQLLVTNVGDAPSGGPITLTDSLPAGIRLEEAISNTGSGGLGEWSCTPGVGNTSVTCTIEASVVVGGYAPSLTFKVTAPAQGVSGSLHNEVSISGGGAAGVVSGGLDTLVSALAPPFGVSEFGLEPAGASGAPSVQAGGHPWELTASFTLPQVDSPPEAETLFSPVEGPRDAVTELPVGFVGNALATARCPTEDLLFRSGSKACPVASRIGVVAVIGGAVGAGEFQHTNAEGFPLAAVYNMVPEHGYPAQFGFAFIGKPVNLYASVVHGPGGYRLRVTAPGIPRILETYALALTFFGDPGKVNEEPSQPAFLTNPSDCAAGALSSRLELGSWDSASVVSGETIAFPGLSGCGLLRFEPSLGFAPSAGGEGGSTQADAPSAFTADVKIPQTSGYGELATPPLKTATVTLPAGVSISPSAAQGLAGCQETGPEGINIGSSSVGQLGQDLGDPEATEFGAGHEGGNASAYDDGVYHVARGHCPAASTIGTVEAFTPLLVDGPNESAPLQGHVYLAAPKCGGVGQAACTEASARNGELFGIYLELEGDGVIVKVPGTVAADPGTGRLTATFREAPQFPLSDLKLHFHGGPRAPLANPQSCGQAVTSALLEPWSAPDTPSATVSSSFSVDWDGQGGACPAGLPFSPGFTAGTVTPAAGAFSAFALTFSRRDREQDLSGVSVRMPPGVLGVLKGVVLCGEPQAAQGTCGAQSLIGHTTVTAGAGPQPFGVTGQVFLTGPYKGAPFGLSIVVPAVAGPFNLGNVIVRAAVGVDPHTAQITVTSDPFPQVVAGVPLRVKTVNVTVDRPGFVFNPTNCSQQQVTGTVTGAQGASVSVASPFAVSGCAGLAFKPVFTVSTLAKTGKKQGASLDVKVGYPSGAQANIHSVAVTLPKQLPARLTTIQQACPAAVFDANPASCPAGSNIGTATATTPVLAGPLSGPAYLVSHGGAAFPDLVVVLQGEGVTLDLVGSIDIKHGVTSSAFDAVPDAPIASFELKLPEGPHSGLAAVVPAKAKGSLCAQKLTMPTTITGQNGAVVKQTTKIAVTGCAKPKKKAKHHTHRAHAKKRRGKKR
jgi:hypothetical protein